MPDRSDRDDLRFQFTVIENLAESVRQQSLVMTDIQKTQVSMLERLARIEANRIHEDVTKLELELGKAKDIIHDELRKQAERVNTLEADKDRRDGAIGVWSWMGKNWPFAAMISALGAVIAWANGKLHL